MPFGKKAPNYATSFPQINWQAKKVPNWQAKIIMTQRMLLQEVKQTRYVGNRFEFYSCLSCVHTLRRIVNRA